MKRSRTLLSLHLRTHNLASSKSFLHLLLLCSVQLLMTLTISTTISSGIVSSLGGTLEGVVAVRMF